MSALRLSLTRVFILKTVKRVTRQKNNSGPLSGAEVDSIAGFNETRNAWISIGLETSGKLGLLSRNKMGQGLDSSLHSL